MKQDCCDMFRVLGVPTRVRIIELLRSKGPLGAKKMAEELGITPAAVSQHLRVLRLAGLVSSQRLGYFIPYSLNPSGMEQCGRRLAEVCICDCGGGGRVTSSAEKWTLEALEARRKNLEQELRAVNRRIAKLARTGRR